MLFRSTRTGDIDAGILEYLMGRYDMDIKEMLSVMNTEPDDAEDINQKKYSKAKYMGKHCQGQQEVKLDGIGPTIRSEHHGNIEYRRLSKEHGGVHKEELAKGLSERRLTIRECARIQNRGRASRAQVCRSETECIPFLSCAWLAS